MIVVTFQYKRTLRYLLFSLPGWGAPPKASGLRLRNELRLQNLLGFLSSALQRTGMQG